MAYTPFQQPAEFNAPDYWASLQGGNSGGMQTRMGPTRLEILAPRTLRWMPYGAPQPSATSPGFTATTTPTAYVPTAESITSRPPDVPGPGGNVNTANNPPPPAITYRPPDVPGPGGNVNTANNPPPTTTVSYRPPDVPGPYGNVNTTNNPAPVTPPSPVTPPPSGFSNPSYSPFGPANHSEQSGHLPPAPGFNPDGSRYGYTFAQQDAARAAIATPAPPIRTDPVRPPGGYADGGPIRGPGGPRQDNLLVRASHGEFVGPADVVRHKGTEFFSRLIDKSREDSPGFAVPRGFADGGEVVDPTQGIDVPTSGSPGYAALPSEGQPPSPAS